MHSPIPFPNPTPASDPPAMVRHVGREDVLWNRPVFKAPPLRLNPKFFDSTLFAEEFRRISLGQS